MDAIVALCHHVPKVANGHTYPDVASKNISKLLLQEGSGLSVCKSWKVSCS